MEKHFQNNKQKYNHILQLWISQVVEGKLWEKYNDIHIDDIEPDIEKNKELWIAFSLFLFSLLLKLFDRNLYNAMLVIPLSYSKKATDIKKLNWNIIIKNLDWTPPSFYIFPKDEKNYVETINEAEFISQLCDGIKYNVYFKEDLEDIEYSRNVYIIQLRDKD